MKKYYRVTTGCSKCAEKGYLRLDPEEYENWQCPYNDPHCTATTLQLERWTTVHARKLILWGGVALLLIVILIIASGAKQRELRRDVDTLQSKVNAWRKEVGSTPTNRGLGSPKARLHGERLSRKTAYADKFPHPERRELLKLEEDKETVSRNLKEAEQKPVQVFEELKPLTEWIELRKAGQSSLSTQNGLKSRARHLGQGSHEKTLSSLQQKIQAGLKELRKKSEPPFDSKPPNAQESQDAYIAALKAAEKRIDDAISEAKTVIINTPPPPPPVTPEPPEWEKSEVLIHVSCSSALFKSLIEKLITDYTRKKNGGKAPKALADPEKGAAISKYVWSENGKEFAIGVGTTANKPDSKVLFSMLPDGPPATKPEVIALDAMVAVANPNLSVKVIAEQQFYQVLDGTIRNWKQLGGVNEPIQLIAPAANSSDALAVPKGIQARYRAAPNVLQLEEGQSVKNAIKNNPAGFGLTSYHLRHLNALAVSSRVDEPGIGPRPFTISTEDYRFCQRVYARTAIDSSKHVKAFIAYILSRSGQTIVAQANYIDLRVQPIVKDLHPGAVRLLGGDIVEAYRLSTNFRFALDSDYLDLKALDDIGRVQKILFKPAFNGMKCVVTGFADSQGTKPYNRDLSKKRARAVTARLENAALPQIFRVVGLGEELPVADNDSKEGRAKNRRVEVWLVETRKGP